MMGEIRVVPSGKVYRQIFDAEVQLVHSLNEVRRASFQHGVPLDSGKIPVVGDLDTRMGGILSHRQKLWTQGMPNDGVTENPTLYRETCISTLKKLQEHEDVSAAREVQGLADTIVSETTGSELIQRIKERKQEQHEETVAKLQQELTVLSGNFESGFYEAGETFCRKFSESDAELHQQLEKVMVDEELRSFTMQGLQDVWDAVLQASMHRRQWIKELDETFKNLESERAKQIGEALKTCSQSLEKIAYLMPSDVYRFIDKEAMMINQAILANKRAVAKLYVNLMEQDLRRELSDRLQWEDRVQAWKSFKRNEAVQKFREFMSKDSIQKPENRNKDLELIMKEQKSLNNRRIQLLMSASDVKPPACNKTMTNEWHSSVSALNKQIDTVNIQYMNVLRLCTENVLQECLDEIETCKDKLSASHVCSEKEAQQLVDSEFLPVVGSLHRNFEKKLEAMDICLEKLSKRIHFQCKTLFKFAQGGAHLWDVLQINLAQEEKNFVEKLDTCRIGHDHENQVKEANLDIMMDKLRQESSEEGLKTCLEKVLLLLEEIKRGYETFHGAQAEIVESYPDAILNELNSYSKSLNKYFGVKEVYNQESLNEQSEPNQSFPTTETFTTKNGKVYSLTEPEHGNPLHETFITESFEEEKSQVYLEQVIVPESVFIHLRKSIRLGFFEHIEEWLGQAISNSRSVVALKKEELKSELELRFHLHRPRAKRIEMDIHNVRAAELILHRERVESHCRGVTEALNKVKDEFSELNKNLKKHAENFRKIIVNMETAFVNATKCDKLDALSKSLRSERDKHMDVIKTSLRQYRQKLEDTMGQLRDSNADFIKSFRLFAEGGNFSPDEITVFRRKLEKMSGRIDSTEGFILADLEGMESKWLEQATEFLSKFEDKFQNLTVDLNFMEKIQRLLIHTQVKIKAEVAKSNSQTQTLNSYLEQLEKKISACRQTDLDKKIETSEDVYSFVKLIMEELEKRCKYLNCLLDPCMTLTEPALQGPIATATRSESLKQDSKVLFYSTDNLLQPSKIGKSATEDAAIGVIKTILQTQKSKALPDSHAEAVKNVQTAGKVSRHMSVATICYASAEPATSGTVTAAQKKSTGPFMGSKGDAQGRRSSSGSVRKLPKLTRFDKKYLVFGDKAEESIHFKGIINSILWLTNDTVLADAEEFYKKKERRPISRPEHLQETFEQCADVLVQKLLSYQSQSDDYHNGCLQELREQLKQFEELLFDVPHLLTDGLLLEHLRKVRNATSDIWNEFALKEKAWEEKTIANKNSLKPSLGHPDNVVELENLCKQEEDRQSEQRRGTENLILTLQNTLIENTQQFVSSLASLTEKLLLEFDDVITVDDVQTGKIQVKKEKTSVLIRRKQAGIPLEGVQPKSEIERGSRIWPGIPCTEFAVQERTELVVKETASVTTAKTSKGHLSTIKARNAAHMQYQQEVDKELKNIKVKSEAKFTSVQRWENCWKDSILHIKQLYT
ncbi:coiled-coil domain-containing protein 180 [Protopterus annectens]|uniref:coiled-coil domain-containing protein 180 n=1 Tax=Protopterus annectens TaxID=7888 RepID=UPI001CFB5DC0|nr:coiled-coil domain-containing protein 180 [Protopterus annectens]